MAYKGKKTCRILKDIRRQIAEANDIALVIKECTYQGDCTGTCPRCEAEVAYLERELARRQMMGKAVCISGIAASALLGMPAVAQTPAARSAAVCSNVPQMKNDTSAHENVIPADWEEEDVIFGLVVEHMPEFPGGQVALFKFLSENVHYPEDAGKEGKEGRVICQFLVEKDGSIQNIEVVRSAGDERFDREAVRVLQSMPTWSPGTLRGEPVAVKYTVPVKFSIPKATESRNEQPSGKE